MGLSKWGTFHENVRGRSEGKEGTRCGGAIRLHVQENTCESRYQLAHHVVAGEVFRKRTFSQTAERRKVKMALGAVIRARKNTRIWWASNFDDEMESSLLPKPPITEHARNDNGYWNAFVINE